MDYVTRQFINLTKKFRKELRKALIDLRSALQQQTEAIRKTYKRDDTQQKPEQPPVTVRAELYVPENVEKDRRTHENRQHSLQVWVVIGTWAAFLAASAYAYVAIRQWREMIAVRHQTQEAVGAASRSADAADTANKNFLGSERPWVGMTIVIQNWSDDNTRKAIILFTNSGRRPAKATLVKLGKNTFNAFPSSPKYETFTTDVGSVALIMPSSYVSNAVPLPELTQDRLKELALRKHVFFIYGNIEYEDVLTHAKHWTHACWQYFPGFENGAYGFVNCSTYNDVDPEKTASQ